MPRTTYTAIDPAGRTHTRTTASRSYTHTVVSKRSYQAALADAQSKQSYDMDLRNFKFYAENADRHPERVAGHTPESYAEAQRAARVASVEAQKAKGFFDEYVNWGWCGRADLALKLLAKAQGSTWYDGSSAVILVAETA